MRKFGRIALVVLFAMLFLVNSCDAKWYPGIIHVHSTFSDGDRTPGMVIRNAKKAGFKFLIETDHYEQIAKPQTLRSRIVKDYGFDNYRRKFSSDDLIIIRGAEIETLRGNARAHTLVLGDLGDDKVLMDLQGKEGNQQVVIDYLKQKGFLSVAAHPSLIRIIGMQTWRGECSDFSYDKSQCKGISGIEFFNDQANGYEQTLRWYLNLLGHNNLFVTSGCDRHIIEDPEDYRRWSRVTWVWVEGDCSYKNLLNAFRQGRTYAANNGAYFKNINYLPSKYFQKVARPKFRLSIGFSKKTTSPKMLRIYRDGQLAEGSVKFLPAGRKEYSYECEDKVVKSGIHKYVIEVEGYLVTSPICLDVKDAKPIPPKSIVRPVSDSTTNSYLYRDSIDEPIKANLRKLWQTKSARLIMEDKDLNYIRNYDMDRRVVEMLVKLSETHIVAVRTRVGYEGERQSITRETYYLSGEISNISAHFSAQAFDIFYADGVEIAWQVSSDSVKRAKAQKKISEIIKGIFDLSRQKRDLLPTQIMVYAQADVASFSSQISSFYGRYSGNMGMWANERMWDRIHIGY